MSESETRRRKLSDEEGKLVHHAFLNAVAVLYAAEAEPICVLVLAAQLLDGWAHTPLDEGEPPPGVDAALAEVSSIMWQMRAGSAS